MRPTFKKGKAEVGLAAVGRPYPNTSVKLRGKHVGYLKAPFASSIGGEDEWRLVLSVKKDDGFAWVKLKARFKTEAEGREWVKSHWDKLVVLYDLYEHDEDYS